MPPEVATAGYNSLGSSLGLGIEIPTLDPTSGQSGVPTNRVSASATNATSPSTPTKRPVIMDKKTNTGRARRHRQPMSKSGFSMRSSAGMQGLLLAETGGGLVELDPLGGGSGFRQGTMVMPGLVTPKGGALGVFYPPDVRHATLQPNRCHAARDGQRLTRNGTLLSQGVTSARNAAELNSLLGNSRSKIRSGAKLLSPPNISGNRSTSTPVQVAVALEQGKSRALVEVDIILDSDVCVEGGYLTGNLHVKVRKNRGNGTHVQLAGGKLRVVGFEVIPDNKRHTFYQHAAPLSTISASSHVLYASPPDDDGFSQAREGQHIVPFAMKLPISDGIHVGAKGPFNNRSGVVVKYIAIASLKLKEPATSKYSIAHFYRGCEVYPYFNPSTVLAPASHPLLSSAARNVFLGGTGKVKLTASLHRNIWIAGQKCCVNISVCNDSKKVVKGLTLSLIRTITVFRPHPHLDVASPNSADPDACQTTTTRKVVAETTLEAGQRGLKGYVTAKGWWIGVDPGVQISFMHFLLLPEALSIVRSRLLEVEYAIRVSLIAGSLSSDLSVMLPLRIVNQFSIDPPPSYPALLGYSGIYPPVPPLLIPVPDSDGTSLAQPHYESIRGPRNERRPDLGRLVPMSDDRSARDHVDELDIATLSTGISDGSLLFEKSLCLSQFNEEQDTNGWRRRSQYAHRDHRISEGKGNLCTTQENDIDQDLFDGSRETASDEVSAGGLTQDTLGNHNMVDSDEEIDFVIGSARIDDGDQHRSLSVRAKCGPKATVSAKESTYSHILPRSRHSIPVDESHLRADHIPTTLPSNLIAPEKLTTTVHPRPRRPKPSNITDSSSGTPFDDPLPLTLTSQSTPKSEPTASKSESAEEISETARGDAEYSENESEASKVQDNYDLLSRHTSEESSKWPYQGKTQFSRRVDKLVAAHRMSVNSTVSTTSKVDDGSGSSGDDGDMVKQPKISSGQSGIPTGRRLLPPSLKFQHISERVLFCSKSGTSAPSKVAASLSGSVRSRIAELEGRAVGGAAVTGGRTN